MTGRRIALWAAAAVVCAGAAAPLVNANRFRGRIEKALESALNRRVSIGRVGLNVFTGPGFKLENVLIEEAPGMGIEPFVYVESLDARLRLSSLFTGRLAFSTLRLTEPSVNFVKADAGPWNVAPFLYSAIVLDTPPRSPVPEIQIRQGRLNFKFANTKSVFYVRNADLDVYPDESGNLILRFEGEPARTDHAAQGLGHVVARGVLRPRPGVADELSMSVQLERTAITELTRLFEWRDIGVRGYIASNLKLDGPLSKLAVSGDLRVEDIHRWDLMPAKGQGWTLNYTGLFNLPGQQIDVETRSPEGQILPVDAKFVASHYLTSPEWEASLHLRDLPAAQLLDTARHLGAALPPGARLDGSLNGDIAYSHNGGVKGELILQDASFELPQGGVTRFEQAPIAILNNDLRFGPAEVRFGENQTATIESDYRLDARTFSLRISSSQLEVAQTRSLIGRLLGFSSIPLFDRCQQGFWTGALSFESKDDKPGDWTGGFEMTGAQMELPGLASPLHIASASVELQPGAVQINRIRGRAGGIAIDADYRYSLLADRPDRIRLTIATLPLDQLEHLFLPTLARRQGFLARALRLQAPQLPEWLKGRSIEGTVTVKDIEAGDFAIGALKARVSWNGSTVQFAGVGLKRDDMEGTGRIMVSLGSAVPRYRIVGGVNGIDYREGTLNLEGTLEADGVGRDLAVSARAAGSFTGSGIQFAPETPVDEIAGEFQMDVYPAGPHLALSKLQVTQGQEVMRGQGGSQTDGRLILDLTTTGHKLVRLTGMLIPPRTPAVPLP